MARRSGTVVTVVYNRFSEIARRLPQAAFSAIAETLAEIDQHVQVGMGAGGTGRVYVRGGRSHRASAPGAMPAVDTGALRASMQHEIVRGRYAGYYYTNSDVAPHLEYGTSQGLAPRPFMTPAAERARPGFMRRMRNLEDRIR